MKENPYSKLLKITRKQGKPAAGIVVGEVVSANPLKISAGELEIDKDDVLIADYLLNDYSRTYSTDRLIPNGSDVGTMVYTDGLSIGDQLAMMPTSDKQLYIVLARVRRL